jgi:hypothetical protein
MAAGIHLRILVRSEIYSSYNVVEVSVKVRRNGSATNHNPTRKANGLHAFANNDGDTMATMLISHRNSSAAINAFVYVSAVIRSLMVSASTGWCVAYKS